MVDNLGSSKLIYAYQTSAGLGFYPLVGSLIRAVGKKWRVLVVTPPEYLEFFEKFQNILLSPEIIVLTTRNELEKSLITSSKPFDLVLSLYDDSTFNNSLRSHPQIKGYSHVMVIDSEPTFEEYDLISQFKTTKLHNTGVTAITGTGKGKTTTALGMLAETFLNGGQTNKTNKVAVIQWFKEKKSGTLTWSINEHAFPDLLREPTDFQFYPTGAGFVGSPTMDRVAEIKEHTQRAQAGVELAKKFIASGEYQGLVLDELVDTLPQVMKYLPEPLLAIEDVQNLLDYARQHSLQTIVTGRQITPEWSDYIKTSVVISEIKHPWSSHKKGALSGLDF
jgi:ATP:corrinoid adenosyltransferase